MAHTVETLSKTLKKTPAEVVEILANAGIQGKTSSSEISPEERRILVQNLSKRTSAANIKEEIITKGTSASGAKIQVKKMRPTEVQKMVEAVSEKSPKTEPSAQIEKTEKTEKTETIEKSEKSATTEKSEKSEKTPPPKTAEKPKSAKKPAKRKSAKREDAPSFERKELHIKHKNPKRKLKKRDKTRLSQKLIEEQKQHAFKKPVAPVIHKVEIPEMIKISDLAQKMTTKAGEVLKVMMNMGVIATLNDVIDQDTATLVVEEMGHEAVASKKETVEDTLLEAQKSDRKLVDRAPVVTIMGHVDHGKTSLLDYMRKTKVADAEAGGITQHIGAYQVSLPGGKITFIDTPGHAAFSKMRARGAKATDIVVLVVAADDGVMPQTVESIKHAKEARVPIVVAINKIDKEGADADKIKQALSTHELVVEDWGGDVMALPVSAKTGAGVDKLLESILLVAEILELKAPADGAAEGVVIEARLDKGRGKVTTILVQSGTLKKGDIVIAGLEYGKVKKIINDTGKILTSAGPSMPVEILGLSGVPESGDQVLVVESERKAREVAEFRQAEDRVRKLQKQQTVKVDNLLTKMKESEVLKVPIVLKADVRGSVQALVSALQELSTDEVQVDIISAGVGAITDSDMSLASAAGAFVLGFNVRADAIAKKTADNESIALKYYSVIYHLIDDVKAMMSGMLAPEVRENIIGLATVKEVFKSPKLGDIAGCIVTEGAVRRKNPIRVLRDNVVIYEGTLESLRRFKDDVAEVKSGSECGIGVKNYNDIKIGDQIEVFETVTEARTI